MFAGVCNECVSVCVSVCVCVCGVCEEFVFVCKGMYVFRGV